MALRRFVIPVIGTLLLGLVLVSLNAMFDRTAADRAGLEIAEVGAALVEQADGHLDRALGMVDEVAAAVAASGAARGGAAVPGGAGEATGGLRLDPYGCTPAVRQAMVAEMLGAGAVKSIATVGAVGQLLCDPLGQSRRVEMLSADLETAHPGVTVAVTRILGQSFEGVRVMRREAVDEAGLAAMVPGHRFSTGYLPPNLRAEARIFVETTDGTAITVIEQGRLLDRVETAALLPVDAQPGWIQAAFTSRGFPIRVRLAVPLAPYLAEVGDGRAFANFSATAVGLVVIAMLIRLSMRPVSVESELEAAIAEREFVPYYQPIIDLDHGRLAGCEVLIRRRLADGTIVLPGAFIGVAEASGLAVPMTQALMEQARDELGAAYRDRPHLKIAFNLFTGHFKDFSIIADAERIFAGSGIGLGQLVFELTERHPLPDLDKARKIIRRLQALGVRVALDDAGTGHSGLAHVQQLGVDILKIDKLFVDAIDVEADAAPIVDMLIELASRMGFAVVAEGVERFDQVQYLKARGVREAQGHVFAPALSASSFLTLVSHMDPVDAAGRGEGGGDGPKAETAVKGAAARGVASLWRFGARKRKAA